MDSPVTKLLIVFKADSSPIAQTFDFLHKAISPATYQCNLCRVTYGVFVAKKEWKKFIGTLPFPAIFLHRDEFRKRYPKLAAIPLPVIFAEIKGGALKQLAAADELNKPQDLHEMIALIGSKLG
jgi:hypothetical protein